MSGQVPTTVPMLWVFWLVVAAVVWIVGVYLLNRIEQSGVERWGATGSLFRYIKREEGGQKK